MAKCWHLMFFGCQKDAIVYRLKTNYFRVTIVNMRWTVLVPKTTVMRHERTAVNEDKQPLHRHHHHHHQQQQHQQQLDGFQSLALSQVYGKGVGSGKSMDSLFTQLLHGKETNGSAHRTSPIVTNITAAFKKASTPNLTAKTADDQISGHFSLKHFETSDRRITNRNHPTSASTSVVPAGQQAKVPFVYPTGNKSAAAEHRKSNHRPAIAVIQLSTRAADDKIVYHEPLDSGKRLSQDKLEMTKTSDNRKPQPPSPMTTTRQSTATVNGKLPQQVPDIGVKLPYRSDAKAAVRRPSDGDNWKQRKAKMLGKRRTAEEQQRCRQA